MQLLEARGALSVDNARDIGVRLEAKLQDAFNEDAARYRVRAHVLTTHSGDQTVWKVSYTFTPLKRGAKIDGDDHLQLAIQLMPKVAMKFFADKKVDVKMGDRFTFNPPTALGDTDIVWEIWEQVE